jgi:predicted NUDIX family NTP pyrophosphohydrolase
MAKFGTDSFDGSNRIEITINEQGAAGAIRGIHQAADLLRKLSPEAAASLRGEALRLGEHMESVMKGAARVALQTAIQVSPVDTGLFKSNWQVKSGKGRFTAHPTAEVDPVGLKTLEEGLAEIESRDIQPGESYFIVNAAHHAKALEEGWSAQAPAGVTELAAQAAETWVSRQRIQKRGKL